MRLAKVNSSLGHRSICFPVAVAAAAVLEVQRGVDVDFTRDMLVVVGLARPQLHRDGVAA